MILNTLMAQADVLKARLDDEDGVTAIEYGLIAALVAVFIIGALLLLGGSLDGIFSGIAGVLTDNTP